MDRGDFRREIRVFVTDVVQQRRIGIDAEFIVGGIPQLIFGGFHPFPDKIPFGIFIDEGWGVWWRVAAVEFNWV